VTGYASAIVLEVNGETFPLKDASKYVKDHNEMGDNIEYLIKFSSIMNRMEEK